MFTQLLISRGLKAQLAMQSFVTGQLGIHLDFYPDKDTRLVGAEPSYTEIPTTESSLSALSKTLETIPSQRLPTRLKKPWTESRSWLIPPTSKRRWSLFIRQLIRLMHLCELWIAR